MPKVKTKKAAAKRFKMTGTGKLKRMKAYKSHILTKKTTKRKRVIGMELTAAHLRYLLAIYEVSQTHLDICSRSIAEKLNVTKPSVVRIMNLLMDRGMIVKEHYGKIYLTDRGIFVAKAVRAQLETVLTHFPPVRIDMTEEERYNAALALTSALPERAFTGEYDRLFGPDESEKENAS